MKRYLLSLLLPTDACCNVTGGDADRDGEGGGAWDGGGDGDADTATDDDTVIDTITRRMEQCHTIVI